MNVLVKLIQFLTSRSSVDRKVREDIRRVRAMPFEEAKGHALALITNSARFETITENLSHNPTIDRLGPTLREFFAQFESVREIKGDFFVSRKVVGASSLRPGFLKIGSDFASSELVARPRGDEVFIVTDSEHVLDGEPTIYHNICLLEKQGDL